VIDLKYVRETKTDISMKEATREELVVYMHFTFIISEKAIYKPDLWACQLKFN
jgi:hypothetical protein